MPKLKVYEFRNYSMVAGRRDDLIALFEAEFIEAQEAGGAFVAGTFRDLDDPDRYVWLRGFENMQTRAAALDAFYTSALWQSRRAQANPTILDSDNVLQLHPVDGDVAPNAALRPPIGASEIPSTLIVATTYFVTPGSEVPFAAYFAEDVAPVLAEAGAELVATFATEHAPNSYPRLPIRDGETVFLTLARFASAAAQREHDAALQSSSAWRDGVAPELARRTIAPAHVLRLQPTARSSLR